MWVKKTNKSEDNQEFYGSELYQRMLEWLVVVGWVLAVFFGSWVFDLLKEIKGK